ncbi:amidase [Flavivirga spongiicola]|uniref:Amidase n=1 Tax=Flavivirga spongiicola TaxID=421621 RepID=A0ABU7XZV4_9FLAO|nr:amidase [Flavivirga sp. MEBiC05379]MDO5980985.1 amidase [Flavivirga sp. MEBiC05379]
MKSIIFKSATEITKLIRDKKISCVEVTKQFVGHIETYNKTINAITDIIDYDDIITEAKVKDRLLNNGEVIGPLHGLPITVKDTFNVKGLISSNGNPKLKGNIADHDAELVKRLKEAGAIIIGKTNLALYALDWQSTNPWFGQTNNPYNLNHVVGGSSGGSAAALASGFTALELGTDAGGSIRVPAHFCGVCGIRTTESALPNRGNMVTPKMPRLGRYLTSNGPMARNVDDLALALEVLWNDEQQFSENPPITLKQFEYKGGNLKIAYSPTLDGLYLDEDYNEVYASFLDKIQQSKHELVQSKPSYSSNTLINLWGRIAGFDFGAAMKGMPFKGFISYLFIKSKYKDSQWAKGMSQGAKSFPNDYVQALQLKDDISDTFTNFFKKHDVWLTPVSMAPAFKHQKPGIPFEVNGWKIPYTKAFIPFNFPSTIPGHPIVVIPIGITKKGLPVGIQIHGQKWHDYKVLQIAKELEKLTNGFKIPDMFEL